MDRRRCLLHLGRYRQVVEQVSRRRLRAAGYDLGFVWAITLAAGRDLAALPWALARWRR